MAGTVRYTAVLDACVLFPVSVCDSLLSVATTGLFAPKWTARIDDEWMAALERQSSRPASDFHVRRDAMHDAVPDWEVPIAAWQALVSCLSLPDPNDVHVLAAAIAGHADCIVTCNVKDFPASALTPHGIEAIHPDEFLVNQLDLDQVDVLTAFKEQRARLKKPAMTPEAFAAALERNSLPMIAQRLREAAALI